MLKVGTRISTALLEDNLIKLPTLPELLSDTFFSRLTPLTVEDVDLLTKSFKHTSRVTEYRREYILYYDEKIIMTIIEYVSKYIFFTYEYGNVKYSQHYDTKKRLIVSYTSSEGNYIYRDNGFMKYTLGSDKFKVLTGCVLGKGPIDQSLAVIGYIPTDILVRLHTGNTDKYTTILGKYLYLFGCKDIQEEELDADCDIQGNKLMCYCNKVHYTITHFNKQLRYEVDLIELVSGDSPFRVIKSLTMMYKVLARTSGVPQLTCTYSDMLGISLSSITIKDCNYRLPSANVSQQIFSEGKLVFYGVHISELRKNYRNDIDSHLPPKDWGRETKSIHIHCNKKHIVSLPESSRYIYNVLTNYKEGDPGIVITLGEYDIIIRYDLDKGKKEVSVLIKHLNENVCYVTDQGVVYDKLTKEQADEVFKMFIEYLDECDDMFIKDVMYEYLPEYSLDLCKTHGNTHASVKKGDIITKHTDIHEIDGYKQIRQTKTFDMHGIYKIVSIDPSLVEGARYGYKIAKIDDDTLCVVTLLMPVDAKVVAYQKKLRCDRALVLNIERLVKMNCTFVLESELVNIDCKCRKCKKDCIVLPCSHYMCLECAMTSKGECLCGNKIDKVQTIDTLPTPQVAYSCIYACNFEYKLGVYVQVTDFVVDNINRGCVPGIHFQSTAREAIEYWCEFAMKGIAKVPKPVVLFDASADAGNAVSDAANAVNDTANAVSDAANAVNDTANAVNDTANTVSDAANAVSDAVNIVEENTSIDNTESDEDIITLTEAEDNVVYSRIHSINIPEEDITEYTPLVNKPKVD